MPNYRVCLEEMEGRWIAHVPELFGCFANGDTRQAALEGVPSAVADYASWLVEHNLPLSSVSTEFEVDEIHRPWNSTPDYEVNAFFADDARPLTRDDIGLLLQLFEWSRTDLLAATQGLSEDDLAREVDGNGWPIRRILLHVGAAEWWYMSNLDLAFPREELPAEPFARLEKTRGHFRRILPEQSDTNLVVELDGELWSPRKMARRALWHERDHTAHIWKVRKLLSA